MDDGGAGMGASPPQLRGAVLARLKAEFSLVAMKAGCMRALASLPAEAVALAPPLPLAGLGGPVVPPPPVAVPVLPPASYAGALGGHGIHLCLSFCNPRLQRKATLLAPIQFILKV